MSDNYLVPDQTIDPVDVVAAQRNPQGFQMVDNLEQLKHWGKDNISEKMKESGMKNFNWALGDQELTLSNIDINRDRERIALQCMIIENDFISSLPEEAITPDLMLQLSNLRSRITTVRAPRANQGFERKLQATNITQIDRNMKVVKPAGKVGRFVGKLTGKGKEMV
jgi:hypothetical protein